MVAHAPSARCRAALAAAIAAIAVAAAACGDAASRLRPELREAESRALAAVRAEIDSVEAALAPIPHLTADDRRALRRHLNAAQLASARRLGVGVVEDSAHVDRLAAAGDLVRLEDSTEYWVVRELDHSVPYVTPDTREMLEQLGRRFHERLDSLGLPPFRFQITSVLRTTAQQADLRQGNANAARGTSAHQYGTTVDIAYRDFSAPAGFAPGRRLVTGEGVGYDALRERVDRHARQALESLAADRAAELEGVLGRVLIEMTRAGTVQALRERAQTVFHITVAGRTPEDGAGEPRAGAE